LKNKDEKSSAAVIQPAVGQLRRWDDHSSGLFLITEIDGAQVVIADGGRKMTYGHEIVMNMSSISDLIHAGELRVWHGAFASRRSFMVISIFSTPEGYLSCNVLDDGKIVNISLGSLLMASESAT
jgi:hypothetical protein